MGVRLDIESVRYNERFKALAGMCDNGALALLIAAVVKGVTDPDIYVLVNACTGFILMWAAWHIRGLLESEE